MSYPYGDYDYDLREISEWIDAGNADRDPEARTWGRLAKITEEAGEVIEAYIGATGQNPRKGVTHTPADVEKELYDVALTALAAAVHLRGNGPEGQRAWDEFGRHIIAVRDRARAVRSTDTGDDQ